MPPGSGSQEPGLTTPLAGLHLFCVFRGLSGSCVLFWLLYLLLLFLLRIGIWVFLHAFLHGPELVHTVWPLDVLCAVVEAGKGWLELLSLGPTGHPPKTWAVPVDISIGQNQSMLLIWIIGVISYQLSTAWRLLVFFGHEYDSILPFLPAKSAKSSETRATATAPCSDLSPPQGGDREGHSRTTSLNLSPSSPVFLFWVIICSFLLPVFKPLKKNYCQSFSGSFKNWTSRNSQIVSLKRKSPWYQRQTNMPQE